MWLGAVALFGAAYSFNNHPRSRLLFFFAKRSRLLMNVILTHNPFLEAL